jgi:hypothetical protein
MPEPGEIKKAAEKDGRYSLSADSLFDTALFSTAELPFGGCEPYFPVFGVS